MTMSESGGQINVSPGVPRLGRQENQEKLKECLVNMVWITFQEYVVVDNRIID